MAFKTEKNFLNQKNRKHVLNNFGLKEIPFNDNGYPAYAIVPKSFKTTKKQPKRSEVVYVGLKHDQSIFRTLDNYSKIQQRIKKLK